MLITKEGSRKVCPSTAQLLKKEILEIMGENNGRLPKELVNGFRLWARCDAALHQPNLISYLVSTRLSFGTWE